MIIQDFATSLLSFASLVPSFLLQEPPELHLGEPTRHLPFRNDLASLAGHF
jgi:hypothetical protein